MNNPLYIERLMALAWQSVAAADTTELLKALAALRDRLIIRLEALADAIPKAEASKEMPALLQSFDAAVTDAHWCLLLAIAVDRQTTDEEKSDEAFMAAAAGAQASIARMQASALTQALEAMARLCELLKFNHWETATIRYMLRTAPQLNEAKGPGLAEPPAEAETAPAAAGDRAIIMLVADLTAILSGAQDN
jgi:hypothetical protein